LNVPGEGVLSEIELARQVTELTVGRQVENERLDRIRSGTKEIGPTSGNVQWTIPFFVVVGLLTEYWTGFSLPASGRNVENWNRWF
jgi:hypothetical protein